jgi:hypothetical protein
MMDGWPIAHHVFAGNRLDQTTVLEAVQDLNQRFQLDRVVFVGDRGMMTMGTVKQLRQRQQGVLAGTATPQSQGHPSTISNRRRRAATGNCARWESLRGRRRWRRRPAWWKLPGKKPECAC